MELGSGTREKQESKLSPKSNNPCMRNYTTVRMDCHHGHVGGLLIFIRSSITFSKSHRYKSRYLIPTWKYKSSIYPLMTTPDTLILGDFNMHNLSWYSRSTDKKGTIMVDSINGSDYGIFNWDSPPRVPPNAEPGSLDVLLVLSSLITSCSWQTLST